MKLNRNLLLIGIIFFFGLTSITALVKADTISTLADKDSYVETEFPDFNNGHWDPLVIGNDSSELSEIYLHFNFSGQPTNWEKAEIKVSFVAIQPDVYYRDNPFEVAVSLVEESWDEYSITWNNKPQHGEIITTFTVNDQRSYMIDVSAYISGRTEISVCLNASDYTEEGEGLLFSREFVSLWDGSKSYCPYLIWTFTPTTSSTIHGYSLMGIFGAIAISGILLIKKSLLKFKK